MDARFEPHNTHLETPESFSSRDPQLRRLARQPFAYVSDLLQKFPRTLPGIYTLGGGRQIGKSTLLKQWMALLLSEQVPPSAIAFFSGELIQDHHALFHLVQTQLQEMPETHLRYLLIDEITYITQWDKTIKYLADAGLLENTVLMLTGSDLTLITEARMRFPGRRGTADICDFHYYPLSFKEYFCLKLPDLSTQALDDIPNTLLLSEFEQYLQHGGYLTAINDIAQYQKILPATLTTYSDWIRGDMLKQGKQEHYLREILMAIIKRYGSQVSWNALAQDLSIDHPKTVSDYAALLISMDALFVQSALLEDKLSAAPKKSKKIMFTDPFIYHALRAWLWPKDIMAPTEYMAHLVEACVVTHYRRYFETYYIKAEGEVDIAYIDHNRFWPIEIKWTQQLHSKDLKQILKYPNARIFSKQTTLTEIHQIPVTFLPRALLQIK